MRCPNRERTFVVGDIHGCCEEFEELLRVAGVGADDEVVLVGDLVAKGPDSQGVVQLARERGAFAVLGNHDARVLERAEEPTDDAHSAVARSLAPQDLEYLRALPLILELPQHNACVVHAGLEPGVPLGEQQKKICLTLRSFDERGRPSNRAREGVPWASRWVGPPLVLFGHDALRGLQTYPQAIGLDTGCVYGQFLTGLWLPEKRFVQVRAKRIWQPPGT